ESRFPLHLSPHDDSIRPTGALSPLRLRRGRISVPAASKFQPAPSPSGKAEVCKTSIPGSNPGGASNFSKEFLESYGHVRVASSRSVPKTIFEIGPAAHFSKEKRVFSWEGEVWRTSVRGCGCRGRTSWSITLDKSIIDR